jgi:hypothetical protein
MLKHDVTRNIRIEYRTLSLAVSLMNFLWFELIENSRESCALERCEPEG